MSELGRIDRSYAKVVHHLYFVFDGGTALTEVAFQTDNFVVGAASANVCFPNAAKLVGVAIMAITFGDTVPGDWTIRVRKNEGGADEATFPFTLTTAATKSAGPPDVEALFQRGDTYHVLANGPEKVAVVARLTLEWEIL